MMPTTTVGAGDVQPRPGSPGFDDNAAPYTQQQHTPTLQTTPQPTLTQQHMTFVEPTLPQPLAAGGVATPLRHAAVTMAVPSWPTSGDTTHVLQSPQVPGSHVQVSPPTVQGTQQAQEQQATLEANLAQAAAQVSLQDTIAMLTTTIASLNERLKG